MNKINYIICEKSQRKTRPLLLLLNLCLLLPTIAFAENEAIKTVPEFQGGLNVPQIEKCEKKYANVCPFDKNTIVDSHQWQCIEKKMAIDKFCSQARKIRQLTGYPPMKFKQYGPVAVFTFTTFADGIDVFHMVDTKGQLIPLNTALDLSINKNYAALKKEYPEIALTGFLYWTKINEDLFPKTKILPNKNQQLIFRQELRSPNCVACKKVGIVEMAYEFNQKGVFLQSKVVRIVPLK